MHLTPRTGGTICLTTFASAGGDVNLPVKRAGPSVRRSGRGNQAAAAPAGQLMRHRDVLAGAATDGPTPLICAEDNVRADDDRSRTKFDWLQHSHEVVKGRRRERKVKTTGRERCVLLFSLLVTS